MPAELRREIILKDHWHFVKTHPNERLSKGGVKVQMGVEDGYQVVYPRDLAMTTAETVA